MVKEAERGRQRRNGEGSVYFDKRGIWRASMAWRDPSGKLVRRWASARSEAEARLALARMRLEAGTGEPEEDVTLGAWIAHWLEDLLPAARLSAHTRADYAKWSRHLEPLFEVGLRDLRVGQVDALLGELAKRGYSWNSCRLVKATLSRALGDAVRRDLAERNVATHARIPARAVRPKDKQIWDAATLKRFLEAVRGEPDEGYWLAQVLCGLRPGEAAALLCCDVDLEGRSLYVHGARVWVGHSYQVGPPKTAGSERHVEMPERLAEVLAKVDLSRPDALLFPSRRGGLRDPSGDARRLVRLCDQVGVPRRRPYELRHTCASLMSAAGVPIELAADQLGHANTQMLMTVYRHRVRKVVRTGMDWGGIGG